MSGPLPGLPPVPATAIPRDVRDAGPRAEREYRTALGFEQLLVGRLVRTAMPAGEDGDARASLIPEALTDALMTAGGLGLAGQIHEQLRAGAPR